jgi:two-component system, OmpR family, response regulator
MTTETDNEPGPTPPTAHEPAPPPAHAPATAPVPEPAVRRTILVVDDDPDFLDQMRAQLAAAGFDVVAAGSAREAEQVIARGMPDVAIVDLMLENMDSGFSLCYHIKRRDPARPVILVTAVATEAGIEFDAATDEERSWVKADVTLAKPVRFEQLVREIHRLLKG